jgi:MFS family permease
LNEAADLRPLQLFFLAAAVFVVSAGYGALLPMLPGWLALQMPGSTPGEVARHVGFLSGAYTAGVLVGAPIWGLISDRLGRPRILVLGMVGYVASLLLLLLPSMGGLWTIYVLRATSGLFVAAVVPAVPALVAAHTPKAIRARRFAWLGAASLLGFLFGPALNAVADALAAVFSNGDALIALSTRVVIVLSALLGASMMLGLALTLPAHEGASDRDVAEADVPAAAGFAALWWLAVAVNLVLSGFELGIVLQGRQHAELSTQQVAMMFAECSLVMLAINALLFFTALLDKVSPRLVVAAGSLLGMAGLAALALHETDKWMYIGVSLTSAGTGLVLPVISFLAAGASHRKLGATMGALAAAGALGQTLGSASGGWLFGVVARQSFAWLALPLLATLILLLLRPSWWRAAATLPQPVLSTSN